MGVGVVWEGDGFLGGVGWESVMVEARPLKRLKLIGILLGLGFLALGFRLWDLQVQQAERLVTEHENNTKRYIVRQPRRGEIRAARGTVLATTLPVKTVCADPTLLGPYYLHVARVLSPILQMSEAVLGERLQPRLRPVSARLTNVFQGVTNVWITNYVVTNRYVVLKRKVLVEDWMQVTQAMRGLRFGLVETNLPKAQQRFFQQLRESAVFGEDDQLRVYPNKSLLAHVLGFVGAPDPWLFDAYDLRDASGLERRLLAGADVVSRWVRGRLREGSIKALADPATPPAQRQAILLAELNRAVMGPLMFESGWRGRLAMGPALADMLARPMAASRVPRFNRLLLEETYASELRKSAQKAEQAVSMEGKYGVEQVMDGFLRGAHGWRRTEKDGRSRELTVFREQDVAPEAGRNVVLTIDARIQDIAETELAEAVGEHGAAGACAIAVRPVTGEILALAVWPTFDPNDPGASPTAHLRNRAIADSFEPGSTFKCMVVAGALDRGDTTLGEQFDCENGAFYYGGRLLRDAGHHYGILSVQEILMKSSNIGAAKVGIRMGMEGLYECLRAFGFGERTGVPLEGEVRGLLRPPRQWTKLSISRIPMGQEIAVTPMQMVMAMAAIANEGRLMRPMLIARVEDEEGRPQHVYTPQFVRQVIRPEAARAATVALKTVMSKEGTGRKARMEFYSAAAKTGTAQKSDGYRYVPGKYFSSFIGFYPADRPEVCLGVFLDEPQGKHYYGGDVAAPAWKAMAERIAGYLHLEPDQSPGVDGLGGDTLAVVNARFGKK